MPREVWGYEEDFYTSGPQTGKRKGTVTQTPRKDFTPKRDPISTKYTDPAKYAESTTLKSSTQGLVGRNPHVDSTWGKPSTGIQYTPHQATKDATAVIQGNRRRDRDDDGGGGDDKPDTSGQTVRETRTCPSGTTGTWPNCVAVEDTTEETGQTCQENGGENKCGTWPNCKKCDDGDPKCSDTGKCGDYPNCKDCDDDDDNGGDPPSLTTINKPEQTPMLQELTSDMDLRNMLGNVLNKNNPLFKQARTRALQAMAARGVVNSSMAEESVMSAVMNVAMPIATRVIDDLQRVMAANVNASNAFKMALNEAYYKELLSRVEAANTWNLNKMLEGGLNWRAMLEAKTGAADIKEKDPFERYMDMLSGRTYNKPTDKTKVT